MSKAAFDVLNPGTSTPEDRLTMTTNEVTVVSEFWYDWTTEDQMGAVQASGVLDFWDDEDDLYE